MSKSKVEITKIGTARPVLHVAVGEGAFEEVRQDCLKQLKKGERVRWPNGDVQWIIHEAIFDSSKESSAQFIWDRSGNRAKHETVLYTKRGDVLSKEVTGTSFRSID